MPPKLSKSAKEELILNHLHATGTCHTLKELERTLPGVASINSIQVKEYIQALVDDSKLRVEKIGSGNWYWSFRSDAQHERARCLDRVQTELEQARKSRAATEAALADETTRRHQETDHAGLDHERETLLGKKAELMADVDRLRAAMPGPLASHKGRLQLQTELAGFKDQAQQWTDNLYVLETYLGKLAGGDREMIATVLRECYGEEYVEGEGLQDL
ncbi:Meiotic nuclear division protein 1 [Penicillium capsulatum]|nr:Meiotic nuclear division protein 1 [Penicillium capsulatum]